MKALLPFYALYVGDGSTTTFTLDVSKDPFYISNDISSFNVAETLPGTTSLSKDFDSKIPVTALLNVQANKAVNNNSYGIASTSIDQYQLTFNLSSTPANGDLFAVQGFIEY